MRTVLNLIKSAAQWLIPQNGETLLMLLCLFTVAAVISPELLVATQNSRFGDYRPLFEFAFPVIVGSGIAAGLASYRLEHFKRNWWFVAGLAGVLFYLALIMSRQTFSEPYRNSGNQEDPVTQISGWWLTVTAVVAAFVSTKLMILFASWTKKKFKLERVTRTQAIVGIAIAMFCCLTARNILEGSRSGLGLMTVEIKQNPALFLTFGVLLYIAIVPLTAWAISQFRSSWSVFIAAVFLGALLVGFLGVEFSTPIKILSCVFAILFPFVVGAVAGYPELTQKNSESPPRELSPNRSWSLWSVGLVTLTLAVAVLFWNMSLMALVSGGDSRFKLARMTKQFSTSPGLMFGYRIWSRGFNSKRVSLSADIKFTADAKPDCLDLFVKDPNVDYAFALTGLTPEIETASLKKLSKVNAWISKSKISSSQLADIASGSNYMYLQKCTIVGEPVKQDFPLVQTIYLQSTVPGDAVKFLKIVDENKFTGTITINPEIELSEEDWLQILRSSEFISISAQSYARRTPIPAKLMEIASKDGLGKNLEMSPASMDDPEIWQLMCETPISAHPNPNDFSKDMNMFWDAAFASRGKRWAHSVYVNLKINGRKNFKPNWSDDPYWAFERDAQGQPEGLLVPFEEAYMEEVAKFTQLKTLSFDMRWLDSLSQPQGDVNIPSSHDISSLGNLTNLKRLELPPGFWAVDVSCLNQIPQLEHLQFDVLANGMKNPSFGFKATDFPNLKSLVLVGEPPKGLAIEVSKLPKLESLKVIDFYQGISQSRIDSIKKTIGPIASFDVVKIEDDQVDLPAAFVEHLNAIRADVAKRRLK